MSRCWQTATCTCAWIPDVFTPSSATLVILTFPLKNTYYPVKPGYSKLRATQSNPNSWYGQNFDQNRQGVVTIEEGCGNLVKMVRPCTAVGWQIRDLSLSPNDKSCALTLLPQVGVMISWRESGRRAGSLSTVPGGEGEAAARVARTENPVAAGSLMSGRFYRLRWHNSPNCRSFSNHRTGAPLQ